MASAWVVLSMDPLEIVQGGDSMTLFRMLETALEAPFSSTVLTSLKSHDKLFGPA
jgi:hypothetical protein